VKLIKITAYYHHLWHKVEFMLIGNKLTIRDISKQKQYKTILKDFDKRTLHLELFSFKLFPLFNIMNRTHFVSKSVHKTLCSVWITR
jgi:hypothetical protein